MSTTILIATDYSLESLNILKKVLKEKNNAEQDTKYKILMVSGYDMGDSIRDLLFNTKSTVFNKVRAKEFCEAYAIIANKYSHLVDKIVCDIFTGSMQRAFNNYVKAENITEAYYSPSLKDRNTKGKFDLAPYIRKCKELPSFELVLETPKVMPEKGRLAEVFAEV